MSLDEAYQDVLDLLGLSAEEVDKDDTLEDLFPLPEDAEGSCYDLEHVIGVPFKPTNRLITIARRYRKEILAMKRIWP